MSGHVSGCVPNQASPQLPGLLQQKGSCVPLMHNLGAHAMDDDLKIFRHNVWEKITQILRSRASKLRPEWLQKLPELAKRLEGLLYNDAASKEEYMNMTVETIEQRVHRIIPGGNQPSSHNIASSSSISTMIPTPGMPFSGSTRSMVSCHADNSMITTSGADVVAQTTANIGNLFLTANGSAGSTVNRYQQSPANASLGPGGNNIMSFTGMSRSPSQMIPTPGLNNPQLISINSENSNGVGFSSIDSSMVPPKQQRKQYVGSQNSHILHTIGGQIGVGSISNFQKRPPLYGSSNGVMNGGLGMSGSSIQMVNGPAASGGYLNMTYDNSQKPLHQKFDQQYHQPMLPTSFSQQMLPMSGDGYAMNSAELSGSEDLYVSASSVPSGFNSQSMNPMRLQSKPHTNNALLPCNTNLQPTQHLLTSRQQMQNFQQWPNQPCAELVQHHHHQPLQQQREQQQQLILENNTLGQFSMDSCFEGPLMSEHDNESHNEPSFPQAAEQFQAAALQSQCQQDTYGDHPKGTQLPGHSSDPQYFQPSSLQPSQQMSHLQQQASDSQNDYNGLFSESQPDALHQDHWHPQPVQKPQRPDKLSFEKLQELQKNLTGQGAAQQSRFEACVTDHAAATQSIATPQSSSGAALVPGNSMREQNYRRQQRWLLLLIHARRCPAPKGACREANCMTVQELCTHMESCNLAHCVFPRCCVSKILVMHFRTCHTADCPVCFPVRNFLASNRKACSRPRPVNKVGADSMEIVTGLSLSETSEVPRPLKRLKVQPTYTSSVPKKESSPVSATVISPPHVSQEAHPQQTDTIMSTMSEVADTKIDLSIGSGQVNPPILGNEVCENQHSARPTVEPLFTDDAGYVKQETMLIEKESGHGKMEVKQEANAPTSDAVAGSKSEKPKIKGVSLTELFTPEQIKEHIVSLRRWVGQSKAKAEKNQAMEHSMSENSCQLCALENLTFDPPPIYCTPCGARIKRNATYYTIGTGDALHCFCIPCYNEARGDSINVGGSSFSKVTLEKKKNDEETEEWWVECDKCQAWQHQICALFNGRRNNGDETEYTCPNCYIKEIENGERKPLAQSAVLGAKDMPTTILSDHIEQRLFRRLKQERQERARHLGKKFDEVPGAEALVVRVVSSVDKKLEVKQRFLEIFQEENYPIAFPYKSKVVLLFQKIEGVEVCLFGMYVQEFGSECHFPNQRRVYLSYLDSVKYFRPEIRTVSGEALRTFVYHEILIGYLEYCKKRGFSSCYIWACPPLKGEDYILYCHPEIQKTPKSDKLREWYLSMLRKASKENVVVELTNLYDHFFVKLGERKAKVTAARLPYFDGDYWPGAAEDMINQLLQEEDGRKQQKKGKTKKSLTKRALKAAGQTDLTGNASKDALLMQKLGETICPMKEDFIMVHLQHACTHCCLLMVSGTRWVCNQCKNFQLCDKCHDAEQRLDERERHPINSREKHVLCSVDINDVPSDTKDKDEIVESEFFDTRQAFLSLCQGNHYQYDTLRRAKHSSMMVLYHLHNPTAPAFVTSCKVCHHDIETGQGWRCEICPDFDICNACYLKDGCVDHPHKLINHPPMADRDAQNQEARRKRVLQLKEMLDLLVHASNCHTAYCQYPNCRKVKGLFRHARDCPKRVAGGCTLCKKMWHILQLHSRDCKESGCRIPRCRDLKEHVRLLQQQSESRRRAAVNEMMRQRAAEVAALH